MLSVFLLKKIFVGVLFFMFFHPRKTHILTIPIFPGSGPGKSGTSPAHFSLSQPGRRASRNRSENRTPIRWVLVLKSLRADSRPVRVRLRPRPSSIPATNPSRRCFKLGFGRSGLTGQSPFGPLRTGPRRAGFQATRPATAACVRELSAPGHNIPQPHWPRPRPCRRCDTARPAATG